MVNCNPETVSTDYDTSDRLYFEPLTAEDVLEILHKEQENGTLLGVIVQFGGQTPLKLAKALESAGIPILGTSPDMIDLAEDRDRFKRLLDKLGLKQPENGIAYSVEQAPADAAGTRPAARRAPVLRAGRPRHGDHPRRGDVRPLPARHPARAGAQRDQGALSQRQDGPDQHGSGQEPAAVRPLPVGRHRGGRRLPVRRQGRVHRRHHGAHRGSGHPFGRFGLLAAAALAAAGDHRRAGAPDERAGAGAPRRRPHERAIRAEGRRHLRAGGEPPRVPHGALRRQGHRRAHRQDRLAHHGGRDAGELRPQARRCSTISA